MLKPQISVVAHNIRSCHNVGSLMRTCDGIGAEHLYLSGYTPYPSIDNDSRMPHISAKISRQIHKTALGAENSISWSYKDKVASILNELKNEGYKIVGLEQTSKSIALMDYSAPSKIALVLGNEVQGIDKKTLSLCDDLIEIPMRGAKESFNVVIAAAITLYTLIYS